VKNSNYVTVFINHVTRNADYATKQQKLHRHTEVGSLSDNMWYTLAIYCNITFFLLQWSKQYFVSFWQHFGNASSFGFLLKTLISHQHLLLC